jgi:hypothetical protein
VPIIPVTQEAEVGGSWVKLATAKEKKKESKKYALFGKLLKQKRAGDIGQVVECLSSKHNALSSHSSTAHPP